MPLTALKFKPGINRESTSYSNEGGWFSCDKIRFRFGAAEKIGGGHYDILKKSVAALRLV